MPKKILLVDDDQELCQEVADILRDEGYAVDNASQPHQGVAFIQGCAYDVYLFDYKMTELSGVDLLKKAKETNPSGKVFIVSGRSFIEQTLKDEGVEHLVAGVINKPFNIEILLKSIKASF